MCNYLLSNNEPRTKVDINIENYITLNESIEYGNEHLTKDIIEKCTDINAKDNKGWTSLHLASENGYDNIVQYLIEKGANINEKNKDNWTPLHFASEYEHENIVQYLIVN